MSLTSNDQAFKHMAFSAGNGVADASADRQKMPRIIKDGKISMHSPAFKSLDTPHQPDGHHPTIRVNKNGSVIESVEIYCSCGQHLALTFDYDKSNE